jgi:hypothetical protein
MNDRAKARVWFLGCFEVVQAPPSHAEFISASILSPYVI